MAVTISPGAIALHGDGKTVSIESPSLVNGLIQDQKGAVALLNQSGANVKLSDISVDTSGRVVISNPNLHKTLTDQVLTDRLRAAEGNGVCGAGCGGAKDLAAETGAVR
jgi:hypothetical protein